ncbi:MAG TPA: acylphosphatase [Candidatus Polarisedimenticolaceae bacterium]
MASETRVRLVVSGRVQGVGFRFAAGEAAAEIGVAGWVRNLPDGSVEIVAQGPPSKVASMTAWAARGPRYATVDGVHVEDLEPLPGLAGFEIRR